MARRVEVLQVESVVPCLLEVRAPELPLTDLELDRDHSSARDDHRVDSRPEPGDVELEVEPAGVTGQR